MLFGRFIKNDMENWKKGGLKMEGKARDFDRRVIVTPAEGLMGETNIHFSDVSCTPNFPEKMIESNIIDSKNFGLCRRCSRGEVWLYRLSEHSISNVIQNTGEAPDPTFLACTYCYVKRGF